jgi:hypothetical protein
VAKVRGKIDPGDFKSVVTFLIRRIIGRRLEGNLFTPAARTAERVRKGKRRSHVLGKRSRKATHRK